MHVAARDCETLFASLTQALRSLWLSFSGSATTALPPCRVL